MIEFLAPISGILLGIFCMLYAIEHDLCGVDSPDLKTSFFGLLKVSGIVMVIAAVAMAVGLGIGELFYA